MWIDTEIDLRTMPIFIRAGSIIPYGEERLSTKNRIGNIAKLEVYSGAEGRLEYDDFETRFTAVWDGHDLTYDEERIESEIIVY